MKTACIKAELACAAVMLASCVIYVIIFVVVAIRVRNFDNRVQQSRVHATAIPHNIPPSVLTRHPQSFPAAVGPLHHLTGILKEKEDIEFLLNAIIDSLNTLFSH